MAGLLLLAACGGLRPHGAAPAPQALPAYTGFGGPQAVVIRHYGGEAMEPFITRDGRYLLFNNRNDPAVDTNLHIALRVDDLTFDYRGTLTGANSAALDAVPSVDGQGRLYFISTRQAGPGPRATLWRGRLAATAVSAVEPVAGIGLLKPGTLVFDAEVAADGNLLLLAEGEFDGGPVPRRADLSMMLREGDAFRRPGAAQRLLQQVNSATALEYAPALSADGLELFFTRSGGPGGEAAVPAIMRSTRPSVQAPFGPPQPVAAISGFAEGPALSPDGRSLYYHKLEGTRFVIYRVAR